LELNNLNGFARLYIRTVASAGEAVAEKESEGTEEKHFGGEKQS
jgi:hypothetical protein